jgi:hypothetical protein
MNRLLGMLLVIPLTFSAGCGNSGVPNPVPVTGKILYKGQPVEDARVTFHWTGGPGGRSATGKTDAQGNFQLTTAATNDGAVPGDYIITVKKLDPGAAQADTKVDPGAGTYGADYGAMMSAAATGSGSKAPQSTGIPPKYGNPGESDIQRSVVAGQSNDFTIDLD